MDEKELKEELKNYTDFRVNEFNFDDYLKAKAYKQKLLDEDKSVIFSGYDSRIQKRVNFYIYTKSPDFERRPLAVEIDLCCKYYKNTKDKRC